MRRTILAGSSAALALVAALSPSPAAAAEHASGHETADVSLVVATTDGVRQVLSSVVLMQGVFDGVGRLVETESRPGDAPNTSRDDLVFQQGSMHIISAPQTFKQTVDPESCVVHAVITQQTDVVGGTGLFDGASGMFQSTLNGQGVLPRAADGSCDEQAFPLREIDLIRSTGELSF
jgi:hypothetical protein